MNGKISAKVFGMSEETAFYLSRGDVRIFSDFENDFIMIFKLCAEISRVLKNFFQAGLLKMHSRCPEELFKK